MNDWDRAYRGLHRPPAEPEPAEREMQDAFLYVVAAIALLVIIFGV